MFLFLNEYTCELDFIYFFLKSGQYIQVCEGPRGYFNVLKNKNITGCMFYLNGTKKY